VKLIHFADLHLGVENYGRLDPTTGLSSRLGDFLAAFDELVDYALENKIDLVLFGGDAYKTREPGQTPQREFARRIGRLAAGGIPVFLLTGNHDMPNASWRATATEIFDTLAIQNVYVANRPDVFKIATASGNVQIAALPWLRRSALLRREDIKNLSLEEVNQRMQAALTQAVADLAARLDPALPAVLAAHCWVTGARVGSESLMAIGQEPALLLSNIALPAFDYCALGHLHKHQVLAESPPVVYAGSLERVDFGEENDEKGFCVVTIETDPATGQRHTSFEFRPVHARRFLTIKAAPTADDLDPTAAVLKAIAAAGEKVKDAIVRLNITLPAELAGQLRDGEIREALKEAHTFSVTRELVREARSRLGSRNAEEITPLDALRAYLEAQQVSPERQKVLMEYGQRLIEGDEEAAA
jgi:exonuclease SbcD